MNNENSPVTMTNQEYWDAYEQATGKPRPPWIDGVGNVNWQYGKKDPPKPPPAPARVTAQYMPQVRPMEMSPYLMPGGNAIQAWRPGLRGWKAGW